MLAWLLAIFGKNFWQFNVMELFATFAILFTAGIATYKWRKGKSRQDALIRFPNNWSANYDKNKNVVHFRIYVNVLITFHAYSFSARLLAGGKSVHSQNVDTGQPMINKEGKIYLTGEIPISEIPKDITELEIQGTITLDGDVKKSSGIRKVSISDINLSEPRKGDSQKQ